MRTNNIMFLPQYKRFFSTVKVNTSILQLLEENSPITRIRIWRGPHNSNLSNLGRVSIETKDVYISLWPNKISVFNNKTQMSKAILEDQGTDFGSIRPPEYMVDLCSLNQETIKAESEKYLKSPTFISENYIWAAYKFLVNSGLNNLISPTSYNMQKFTFISCDFAKLILEAHDNELKLKELNLKHTLTTGLP